MPVAKFVFGGRQCLLFVSNVAPARPQALVEKCRLIRSPLNGIPLKLSVLCNAKICYKNRGGFHQHMPLVFLGEKNENPFLVHSVWRMANKLWQTVHMFGKLHTNFSSQIRHNAVANFVKVLAE